MRLAAGFADPAADTPAGPTYDEQIGTTFTQDFPSLAYNVSALAQVDADSYGPGYLLNGLTTAGYWYQIGISYHWPNDDGTYDPTFGFGYDVFGPDGQPVYPTTGGSGIENFTTTVNSGDSVLLSLTFKGQTVLMQAFDWNTGATAQVNYSSEGSSKFVGNPSSRSSFPGYFTGLMTEWYHLAPYSGSERGVTFTNDAVALSSAWMWIEEFNAVPQGATLFSNSTRATFADDQQVYPFYADGAMLYASAHQFITGLPASGAPSKVTITPAAKERATPSFSAAYTLSGHPQTVFIPAGATVLKADPGSSITLSINSPSSRFDRWVFNGTSGTAVTISSGTNATYALYHVVLEIVSYQIAAGGQDLPGSSAPELRYGVPPSVASATAHPEVATQVLGTVPLVIYALLGSNASVTGTISGAAGERWVAGAQSWAITAEGLIPEPIVYFQQYQVSVSYSVLGGGAPSPAPRFTAAALGRLTATPLSSVPTAVWFDAASAYSFTGVVLNSAGTERWISSGEAGSAPSVISSPNLVLSAAYSPQYFVRLAVNEARGGAVSGASGWFDPGTRLAARASPNQGWYFEGWSGSGAGAYTGNNQSLDLAVAGPLSENATFYLQLAITADAGTNIAFSSPSQTGVVQAGTTKTLYIPPSNVSLRATPSSFIFSFTSWKGANVADAKNPSLVLSVGSPSAVTGTSSYQYAGVLVLATVAAAILLNVLSVSLWIRNRRRKKSLGIF
jgi:hypothetical protein